MKLKQHIKNHQRIYLILLLWLVVSFFNFGKAFHIDDTFHIEAAQHIIENPTSPMSGEINWGGNTKSISEFNQPPLFFYLIAILIKIFGANEFPLHCLIAIFSLLSIYYFDKILHHFQAKNASFFLVIFALCPAFVVNQNVMTDIPLLSMILASTYYFLTGSDNKKSILLSFVFITLALLIKYSAIPFLGALIIALILKKDFKNLKHLLIPILAIVGWSIWNFFEFDHIHLLSRPRNGINIIRFPEFLCCLGAILLIGPFRENKHNNIYYGIITTALSTGFMLSLFGFPHLTIYLQSIFLLNAITVLFFALKGTITKNYRPQLFLILTLLCMSAFIIFFAPFIATRHILLTIPFLLFLIHLKNFNYSKNTKGIAIIISSIMLIGIGSADRNYANFYRAQAELVSNIEGKKYTIGYWGWQWYARHNGIVIYDKQSVSLQINDLMIVPKDIAKQGIAENIELSLLKTIVVQNTSLNPFSVSNHGSFYNSFIDRPVWTFSSQPLDTLCVYKVTRVID